MISNDRNTFTSRNRSPGVNRFRNYDCFKFFSNIFPNFKKKKSTVILKILMISEKSNGRFTVK